MSNLFVKVKQFILLVGDLALFYLSLALTLELRYHRIFLNDRGEHLTAFTIIYLCLTFVFYINELYDLEVAKNDLQFIKKISESMVIGTIIAVSFFYLTPFFGIAPKTNLFLNLAILSALIIIWRLAFNYIFRGRLLGTKVLLIGSSNEMTELAYIIKKRPFLGFETYRSNGTLPLEEFVKTNHINIVVVDKTAKTDPLTSAALYNLISSAVHVTDCLTFYEEVMMRIPISILDEIWFVENFKETKKKLYDEVKQAADFAGAMLLAIPLMIITVPVALAIKLDSPGPIFFSQKRVGKNGKIFSIAKFRTMAVNAENLGAQFAAVNDPRVTRVGRVLRKFRLDELPQIFNILAGEMSFIGPRPERPEFTKELEAAFPFYPLRYLIKPGLTGWAQIKFSYGASIEENLKKLQYDFYYIKHRSIALDGIIILRTLNLLLHPRGR